MTFGKSEPAEISTSREAAEAWHRLAERRINLDEWSDMFRACLGAWSGKIPCPKQQRVRDLRDPFA